MHVIYVSCTCSRRYFARLFEISKQKPGQQVQKYHHLIMDGLILNGHSVDAIAAPPITRSSTRQVWHRKQHETEQGINFEHLSVVNLPVIRNIWILVRSFAKTFCKLKNPASTVICDVLNMSVTMGALLAVCLKRGKSIGLVTDVPQHLEKRAHWLLTHINNWVINTFDSYVFLTDDMNALLNPTGKPYQIIEGQVDYAMVDSANTLADKDSVKIILYAGGLQKKYGIETLVQAFLKADIPDTELHVYGNGDYEMVLTAISQTHQKVRYFGVVPNEVVINAERRARLLVNPRPADELFTRYSFPSKNMEYMVSGTPVLTTKLPGMPDDYCPYVYLVEDESVDGLARQLSALLAQPEQVLHDKGLAARAFVLKEKNNIVQSAKIIALAEQL